MAANTASTRRTRTRADQPASTVDDGFAFEAGASAEPTTDQERTPLFEVGGKFYGTPAELGAGEAIRLLRDIRKLGNAGAAELMMDRLIGQDGVDALLASKGFDMNRWNTVAAEVSRRVFGALEEADPKAGS